MTSNRRSLLAALALVAAGAPSCLREALAQTPPPAASATPAGAAAIHADFEGQPTGAASPDFDAVVGDWSVAEAAGARGLRVDGSRWRQGTPSANLADQARRLYGDRYAEFLDGVRAFAFFPLAVYRGATPDGDMRISMRFYPQDGRIDQAAGIAFGIEPNGTYLGVRANALEDNVLFFRVVRGHRTVLENIRNTPTPSRTWHTLVVTLRGRHLTAELDGVQRVSRDLDAPPHGRVGLWSKADSQVLFDDFVVTPLH